MIRLFLFVCMGVVLCAGVQQTLTIYDGYTYTGNSVTFVKKMPDLQNYSQILDSHNTKSVCCTGWWVTFSEGNYTGNTGTTWFCNSVLENCIDITEGGGGYVYSGSLRYLGPADINKEAISLYSSTTGSGEEIVVDYAQEPNIPFHTISLLVTGRSNWTLFERPNFSGPSICFESEENETFLETINYNLWDITTIGSIKKSCDDTCLAWQRAARVPIPQKTTQK